MHPLSVMAAAYYLANEAPAKERKDKITTDDI